MGEGLFDCELLLQIDLHVLLAFTDLFPFIISPFLGHGLIGGVEVEHGGDFFGDVEAPEEVEEQGSLEEGGMLP